MPHTGAWKLLAGIATVGLAAILVLLPVFPDQTEASYNRTLRAPPYAASERARRLHRELSIADLHADTLLWQRDPLERASRGHVDLPRLIAGNVALQAFTVVTKVPRGMNLLRNDDASDAVRPLLMTQLWPVATWWSLRERALYQARRLHDASARSEGRLQVIRTSGDLRRYLERRRREPGIAAGLLGIEGAQALEGDERNLETLFEAGFRMLGPAHFFDTFVGGSSSGVRQGGLTETGVRVVRRMEELGMTVDLAHASAATVDDVLRMARRPVVVSHTGVTATCAGGRNLTDDQMRRIAANGGVIGIGYFYAATCDVGLAAIVRAVRHAVSVAGVEHVGLGSDFDGGTAAPFDTTGLVLITDALLEADFTEEQVRLVMGGNVLRLLLGALPTVVTARDPKARAETERLRASFARHRQAYLAGMDLENRLIPETLQWLRERAPACRLMDRWARAYFAPRYIHEQLRFDEYATGEAREAQRWMLDYLKRRYFELHEYQRYAQRACEAGFGGLPGRLSADLEEFQQRMLARAPAVDEITPVLEELR